MNENTAFQDTILKHFNAPEDSLLAQQVEEGRKLSADNEKTFQETKTIWENAAATKRLHQLNHKLAVQRFGALLQKGTAAGKPNFGWFRAAAAIVLVGLAGWFFYPQEQKATDLVKETHQQIDSVLLSDGTKVILAANSRVHYPATADRLRKITLDKGQAFFKVHRDTSRPFQVNIGQSKVSVLGTSFNINYSPAEIRLAVKTGKVMFSPNAISSPAVLVAGQALSYDLKQQNIKWENPSNATSWMTKELEFVDMPLEEVCRQLNDYYHVDIRVRDHKRSAKKFNARFSNSSLEEIFNVLKQTYKIRIDSTDKSITITNL